MKQLMKGKNQEEKGCQGKLKAEFCYLRNIHLKSIFFENIE